MTLRQLDTLRTLRRTGSLAAAARERDRSHAAVSMQMRDLEREIGVPLFRARGRRLTLTAPGGALADYAERILGLVEEAAEATRALHREGGLVRVAASSTPGVSLLPRLLAAYRRRHPRVLVRLRVANTSDVASWVHAGEADVGVVGGPVSGVDLAVEDWREDDLVLVVGRDHRLTGRRRVAASALAGETLLAREHGSATRTAVEAAFLAAGAPLPSPQVVGDTEAIKRAVEAGLGVALLSRFSVADEVRDGRLRSLTIRDVVLRRPLRLLTRRGAASAPATVAFVDFLRAERR